MKIAVLAIQNCLSKGPVLQCRAILTAELTYPPAIKSLYYRLVIQRLFILRYSLLCMQLSFKYITGEGPPLHDKKIVPSKPKTNFKKPQKQPYGSKYTLWVVTVCILHFKRSYCYFLKYIYFSAFPSGLKGSVQRDFSINISVIYTKSLLFK